MVGLLGKKIGMTRIFDQAGRQMAVTVLEVGPCTILQIKKAESDGYQAVQLGFDPKKESRCTKPEAGHAKRWSAAPHRFVREFRAESIEGLKPGGTLRVNNFAVGDWVDVSGTSIGHGFQGVMKRHGFKGPQTMSHGQKAGKQPGSIGQSAYPSRVFKGQKLAGHMGNEKVTVQNLKVVKINFDHNLLVVGGAVPGSKQSFVIVREAVKKRRPRNWRLPDAGIEELKTEEAKKIVPKKTKVIASKKPAAGKKKK